MTSSDLESQRQTILHFWKKGVRKPQEIHKLTSIPLSTIKYNIKKLNDTGTLSHRQKSGRPKKVTQTASRTLGQFLRRDPTLSLRSLANKLSKFDINLSYVTIKRHLDELGYKNSLPIGTPMLTETHKANRVEWAKKHLNDNWNKTIFTDETAFQLFRNTITQWHKGPRPIRPLPKNRQKIFAWAGFCSRGKTSLFCFTQIMDANFYVEIVEKHLPEINSMLGSRWRFQQDNDPKHTSRVAKGFLNENVPVIIDWPSNSPDLNPIENLWAIVKKNVEKRMPKSLDDLKQFLVEEWELIPDSLLINLVNSMKNRCALIIENNGERISY